MNQFELRCNLYFETRDMIPRFGRFPYHFEFFLLEFIRLLIASSALHRPLLRTERWPTENVCIGKEP